jgi:hypothetical protein
VVGRQKWAVSTPRNGGKKSLVSTAKFHRGGILQASLTSSYRQRPVPGLLLRGNLKHPDIGSTALKHLSLPLHISRTCRSEHALTGRAQTVVTAALAAKRCRRRFAEKLARKPCVVVPGLRHNTTTWLRACRTRRGDATSRLSRCGPWGRGRATRPTGRLQRARMHVARAQPGEMPLADQQPGRRRLLLLRERASQRTALLPGARAHCVSVGRSAAQQRGCVSDTTVAALPSSVMSSDSWHP